MRNTLILKKKVIQLTNIIKDKGRIWKNSRLKKTKETRQVNSIPDPRLEPDRKGGKKCKIL